MIADSADHLTEAADIAETHVSTVVFLGDRAYKIKKPVAFGFLDFTDRETRAQVCRREVELNRRLAPDVYLGVADVIDEREEPCEHMVVMRRMPADRRLSTLIAGGADVRAELRAVARIMATFHAAAVTSERIAVAGTSETVLAHWEENVAEMRRFVGPVLDPQLAYRVEVLARRYVEGRRALFSSRIADGKIRDGHGDLLAADIFCLPDGPRILDCIEFDDSLRFGDVLSDVAFLAMDCERLGRPDLARRFLQDYREFSGENYPSSLAEHYMAYRAHVRSKVACLRYEQGDRDAAVEASQLLMTAAVHLEHGRTVLVLIGGLPGTGKSTLADALSMALGWTVLRSDEVRHDVAGIGRDRHAPAEYGNGIYDETTTNATYRELITRAETLLGHGESVIVDASWKNRQWREYAAGSATNTFSELVELRCSASVAVAADRMIHRAAAGEGISDASPIIAARMAESADPWPSAIAIDTSGDIKESVSAALRIIGARGAAPPPSS